jgi:hypothetical protein
LVRSFFVWPDDTGAKVIFLTMYSRSYCHLCDDMLVALRALPAVAGIDIEVIDIDEEPRLLEKYDELVPVLTARQNQAEEQVLCHYFLDEGRLERFLLHSQQT